MMKILFEINTVETTWREGRKKNAGIDAKFTKIHNFQPT